jgi:GMP synthase-like glutamine amidotransferase
MSTQVLVFRHIEHEGPGYLGDFLERKQIPYRMICVDQGERIPQTPGEADALVFMGGPMSVNDPLPWIADELALIRQAINQGIPVLGHCLGGQLLAKALGARVHANPVTEIGWHLGTRIDNTASRDWLAGVPDEAELFHWHGETFDIPAGATPLLQSRFCPNQAFVYGNSLGFQCHIEMTAPLVEKWVEESRGELRVSESVQSEEEMLRDLTARIGRLNRIADTIYTRWLASWSQ